MLILSRKVNEGLVFDDGRIRVVIMKINGRRVQVGIEANSEVHVMREELVAQERRSLCAPAGTGEVHR